MDELGIASGDETLDAASLQASIDALEAMAVALDADIAKASDVDSLQAIGAAQVGLRNREEELVDAQITLLAGSVRVTADHINAAARYAKDVVAEMADLKKKIEAVAAVVDFFGVVMTGDGANIVVAAVNLKSALT